LSKRVIHNGTNNRFRKFSHSKVKKFDLKLFNTERDTTNHYAIGIDRLNTIAFNDGICRLALHLDESDNAPNDVALDKHSKRLLRQYGDPAGIDLIQYVKESIAEANARLRSFKLRLALEESTA
jgi:hypothetical protein